MGKTVFAVAAHPDDIEFVMSGTLMLLKDAGYELHYMNIANGSCGSTQYDADTIAKMRSEEAGAAAEYLGAAFHDSLVNDLDIFYNKETLAKVASIMREVAPEIILTHSPQDYMEDHMNACRLAVTAAFSRGMPNFPVDPLRDHIAQEVSIYHAQPHGNRDGLWNVVRPGIFVDVGSKVEQKVEMLSLHRTQKDWLDESQGIDSYTNTMKDLNREVGQMSGQFEFAEGWRKHSHLGFCSEEANPLVEALRDHIAVG